MQYTVGIDEVGRGPLAGPVAVCAVQWLSLTDPSAILTGIKDSKALTPHKRVVWLERAERLGTHLQYAVHFSDASVIDAHGIMGALRLSATHALQYLHDRHAVAHVYADYGLPVPDHYSQTHLVKGDESNPLIALASIIAKVLRDDVLCQHNVRFPQYCFSKNKGYGTAAHREALRIYGATSLHRQTFLKKRQ